MTPAATKVTIVGGGVAALEAMVALRGLAEERVAIETRCACAGVVVEASGRR